MTTEDALNLQIDATKKELDYARKVLKSILTYLPASQENCKCPCCGAATYVKNL